jgi:geranylgeranyl diphosphate synthase type II
MDDDDFRRGKLTLHKVYPESHAVLAGDYLLTFSFEILSTAQGLTDSQKLKLVRCLSQHAGAHGMIGGQIIDLLSENQTIDLPTLEMMHHYKTAALIIAALEFGGIIGNAPAEDLLKLNQIGKKIGIAFQVIDDTLDLTSSLEEMGKNCGSDKAQHKSTALSIMNLEECTTYAQELLDSALEDLSSLSVPMPLLHALFHRLVNRKS